MTDIHIVKLPFLLPVPVVFDVYRDSQVSNFGCHFSKMLLADRAALTMFCAFAGESVADRPEPVRRGDRLTAVQLGGADVWRNHPAAGEPSSDTNKRCRRLDCDKDSDNNYMTFTW